MLFVPLIAASASAFVAYSMSAYPYEPSTNNLSVLEAFKTSTNCRSTPEP